VSTSAPSRRFNRREALRTLAAGVGATASALWIDNLRALAEEHAMHARAAGQRAPATAPPKVLNPHQFATVGVLVELIIPTTDTPGAKAAGVDGYIDSVLASAEPADRDRFLAGLSWLDRRSQALFKNDVLSGTPAQQIDLLTRLSSDPSSEAQEGLDFFTALKALTITGYYSTEIGLRKELGDDGRMMLAEFEGCTHPEHN